MDNNYEQKRKEIFDTLFRLRRILNEMENDPVFKFYQKFRRLEPKFPELYGKSGWVDRDYVITYFLPYLSKN